MPDDGLEQDDGGGGGGGGRGGGGGGAQRGVDVSAAAGMGDAGGVPAAL